MIGAWQISSVGTLRISNLGQSETAQENGPYSMQLVLTIFLLRVTDLPWEGEIDNTTNSHLLSTLCTSHYSKCFICINLLDPKTTQWIRHYY